MKGKSVDLGCRRITEKIVGLMIFIGAIYEGMKTYYVAYEEQA